MSICVGCLVLIYGAMVRGVGGLLHAQYLSPPLSHTHALKLVVTPGHSELLRPSR